jgi:hypothetical protein
MEKHTIHEHHEKAAEHHEHAARHHKEAAKQRRRGIMKKQPTIPKSRTVIRCTPPSTTSTLRKSMPISIPTKSAANFPAGANHQGLMRNSLPLLM